jgi:hypothetical protein
MKTKEEIETIMAHEIGTLAYHRFSVFPGYPVITDGVKHVADAAECYWLLDIIGSFQSHRRLDPDFQVWKFEKTDETAGFVKGYNDETLVITQRIPFTDFPLDEITFFVESGVILLPSEH